MTGRDISRLLRGKKLQQAEQWQANAGTKDMPLTDRYSDQID
jgi:hypothetical protein